MPVWFVYVCCDFMYASVVYWHAVWKNQTRARYRNTENFSKASHSMHAILNHLIHKMEHIKFKHESFSFFTCKHTKQHKSIDRQVNRVIFNKKFVKCRDAFFNSKEIHLFLELKNFLQLKTCFAMSDALNYKMIREKAFKELWE